MFKNEAEFQKIISDLLLGPEDFGLAISNKEIIDSEYESIFEQKIIDTYRYCLDSLNILEKICEDKNIALKKGEILRPDFLLYAAETESVVLFELKNGKKPTREAGTELSAYSSAIKSYLPFLSDGDIVCVIISPEWPTLLKHYCFYEIFWFKRQLICIRPVKDELGVKLEIIPPSEFSREENTYSISKQHIGGYNISLYDDNLYVDPSNRTRFKIYEESMKQSIRLMASKGNHYGSHGFAFLWKDHWQGSLAPYSITVMNFAPFQSLERLLHVEDRKISKMDKRMFKIVNEFGPIGHAKSLSSIVNHGKKLLTPFCDPRTEGYNVWESVEFNIMRRADYIAFKGWGMFEEIYNEIMLMAIEDGHANLSDINSMIGIQVLDSIFDDEYDFINLNHIELK